MASLKSRATQLGFLLLQVYLLIENGPWQQRLKTLENQRQSDHPLACINQGHALVKFARDVCTPLTWSQDSSDASQPSQMLAAAELQETTLQGAAWEPASDAGTVPGAVDVGAAQGLDTLDPAPAPTPGVEAHTPSTQQNVDREPLPQAPAVSDAAQDSEAGDVSATQQAVSASDDEVLHDTAARDEVQVAGAVATEGATDMMQDLASCQFEQPVATGSDEQQVQQQQVVVGQQEEVVQEVVPGVEDVMRDDIDIAVEQAPPAAAAVPSPASGTTQQADTPPPQQQQQGGAAPHVQQQQEVEVVEMLGDHEVPPPPQESIHLESQPAAAQQQTLDTPVVAEPVHKQMAPPAAAVTPAAQGKSQSVPLSVRIICCAGFLLALVAYLVYLTAVQQDSTPDSRQTTASRQAVGTAAAATATGLAELLQRAGQPADAEMVQTDEEEEEEEPSVPSKASLAGATPDATWRVLHLQSPPPPPSGFTLRSGRALVNNTPKTAPVPKTRKPRKSAAQD